MLSNSMPNRVPVNDNGPIGAEFRKMPEIFISTYAKEIFGWAAKLEQIGPILEVDLWCWPNGGVLNLIQAPSVRLRCDLTVKKTLGGQSFVMVVGPASEADEEIVAKHSEALPAIMAAQHAAAQANRDKPKGQARWLFDGSVPEYFVHRYQDELRAWAHNFKKIGFKKHIVLREGGLAAASENGAVLIQVELAARIDRKNGDEVEIVVGADDHNERLIRQHCEKLERAGIPAGMVLVEPERAGIPILPRIVH